MHVHTRADARTHTAQCGIDLPDLPDHRQASPTTAREIRNPRELIADMFVPTPPTCQYVTGLSRVPKSTRPSN